MADGQPAPPDLHHHGDQEVGPGLVDLAVNVRGPAPEWLRARLVAAVDDLAAYPDPTAALQAIAARHGRATDEVLVTAGGAEAFTLLARALRPGVDVRHAVVVHPQFTEPEAALAAAGHHVDRLLLRAADGFTLDPARVPDTADLVVLGNPTNPTSVLHPADVVRALLRPDRTVVVDEAFMDAVPGEQESLAAESGTPGLVVVRSLTKTWGLAGLRAGYLLGDAALVRRCASAQPPWSVSSLAAVAAVACSAPRAVAEAERAAEELVDRRAHLLAALGRLGLDPVQPAAAPFVLVPVPDGLAVRQALRDNGFAVRRCDTFPGLGPDWLRLAVRSEEVTDAFTKALGTALEAALADARPMPPESR
ncbi:Rv2231c family pyridoxal phosphate-dependent protein CobC [Angustibacter luteus]|uniref:Aminotransferase n=1 Tax=Angustibacter luteus TaxID=658456 RepID=A0ABW1JAU1_9ACTN